jgi:hypothetical protein
MATIERPKLTVPLQCSHVRSALEKARANFLTFRPNEMKWLAERGTPISEVAKGAYEYMILLSGNTETADPLLAGFVLGHHAVRRCVNEYCDYEVVESNFLRNLDNPRRFRESTVEAWNTQEILDSVFGDTELTAALMDVRDDTSRHSAAVTIGMLCLDKMPDEPIPSIGL